MEVESEKKIKKKDRTHSSKQDLRKDEYILRTVAEESLEEYKPKPYVFKIPSVSYNAPFQNQAIRSPPFSVLLDHMIAVIWILYSTKEISTPLGINQLQWTLSFLQNISATRERPSPDIQHCINRISEELILQYADLIPDITPIQQTKVLRISNVKKTVEVDSSANVHEGSDSLITGKPSNYNNSLYVKEQIPFSINYADMIDRSKKVSTKNKM